MTQTIDIYSLTTKERRIAMSLGLSQEREVS